MNVFPPSSEPPAGEPTPPHPHPHPHPSGDPTAPVELYRAESEFEAETIVSALRAHGLVAMAMGGGLAGWRAESPAKPQVMVRREDLEEAKLVLRGIKADSVDIDWDEVDVGEGEKPPVSSAPTKKCARCGSAMKTDSDTCTLCGQSDAQEPLRAKASPVVAAILIVAMASCLILPFALGVLQWFRR